MELFRNRKSERPMSFCEEVLFEPLLCLKEEMCDLASRLVKGAAANVSNLVDWSANVKMAKSSKDLMPLALELASSVSFGNLWSELHDREKWLTEDWTRAVKEATSIPRLRYCVAVLDYCIMWERCSVFLKCKVCRRKGGAMAVCGKCHSGYHVVCLRPSLEVIPPDDWLCPTCRPKERGCRRSTKTPDEPVDDGQEETVVDNHDFCDVCGGDGELVCCDNCPNVYHKECHDPPLRNIPRGFWKCRSCHGRRPTAIKYTPRVEEDEDDEFSDFESSDDETGDDGSYMKTESDGEKSGSEVDQAYGECDENPSSGKRRKKRK
ncbi:tyrosine-protein kinase BAZ1B-like isoform X2 [Xenia sp. Carnegie-2017]|uniref:tyrosine-protein kinase BAZ1B-like isoform X2 n=1 Tax=Xenia sp. Carnegie-2017 TaxID=2897299 RepID=UPI001F03938B|nr:tyrosine-protein kinase BAZ1B-like isoform X2 [Xenia sp. Carnegie-2017]